MSPSAIALTIIFAIVLLGSAIGFYAGTRQKMSLEQWTVGSRGFGTLLMWLLMAGESYTTFSVLGASGWVYSRGGPALYILAYLTLGNVVAFLRHAARLGVGPRSTACRRSRTSFACGTAARYLAAFVAVVGVVFIVPYLQLQLTGLGIIVEVASFESIGRTPAMAIAVTLVAGFVFVSGVRAVAWVSIVKDFLMVVAAVSVGIGVPYVYFGGIGPMFAALASARPAAPGDARRHDGPGPQLVHLDRAADVARRLHVASRFRRELHRQERRHAPAQRDRDAALHADPRVHLLHRASPPSWSCPASPTVTSRC